MATAPLRAQEPEPTPAGEPRNVILVIRHGEDTDNWASVDEDPRSPGKLNEDGTPKKNPWPSAYWDEVTDQKWPEYLHPYTLINAEGKAEELNPAGFALKLHGLSGKWMTPSKKDGTKMTNKDGTPKDVGFGEDQARRLAAKLDQFLVEQNFAPIRRAIITTPLRVNSDQSDPTPNPFDTLWPYLHARQSGNPVELFFVAGKDKSPGIKALIANEKDKKEDATTKQILSPEGGSTILVWTGEGMEGKDGIFEQLVELTRGEKKAYPFINGPTARCSDVAVFYKDADEGVVEEWKFRSGADAGGFEWKVTHPEDKERAGMKKKSASGDGD